MDGTEEYVVEVTLSARIPASFKLDPSFSFCEGVDFDGELLRMAEPQVWRWLREQSYRPGSRVHMHISNVRRK